MGALRRGCGRAPQTTTGDTAWVRASPGLVPDGRMIVSWDSSGSLFATSSGGPGLPRLGTRDAAWFEWSPTQPTLAIQNASGTLTIADLRRQGARLVLRPIQTDQ